MTLSSQVDADWGIIRRDYRRASALLQRRFLHHDGEESPDDPTVDSLIADAAGYLVPAASVAARARLGPFRDALRIPPEWLEAESRTMLATSYLVSNYLTLLGREIAVGLDQSHRLCSGRGRCLENSRA